MIYWFTGQPCAGKTTLAKMLENHYLHNQGQDVIVALVSPYIDQREEFKLLLGNSIKEIYVHTTEARERDSYKAIAYTPPFENFIDINTTNDSEEESLKKIIDEI